MIQPALGCLFLVLLFQTTGGRWGKKLLPALLAGNAFVIPSLLALIPILVFVPTIYHWSDVGDRAIFLNRIFYTIRWAIYFMVFGGLSFAIRKGKQPGAGGLIVFSLVGYFFAIDEVMAIDPKWYSSGFPVVFMASAALMAMALATLTIASDESEPLAWRDIGGLLMAMVVFWSYVAFTQFLIIWMGNLESEIGWYVKRGTGIWLAISILIAVFNLFVPFFLLLARSIKDQARRLQKVAILIFGCQVIYLYWLIAPSFGNRGISGAHWIDPFIIIAVISFSGGRFMNSYQHSIRENI
ncbi:hypothetical protein [Luteolibacter pohnpeiensis]|uniref:hypothetical protein n=1 Tax=Luteolibacter pohnpeiensis TaxID=454153 RepID=UPI00190677F8|nr:hypothetical protein [Luteolibacter pohnpeiensis]